MGGAKLCRDIADRDLYDPREPSPDELYAQAKTTEAAARAVEGVTNSEGAGAGYGTGGICLATSGGFTCPCWNRAVEGRWSGDFPEWPSIAHDPR